MRILIPILLLLLRIDLLSAATSGPPRIRISETAARRITVQPAALNAASVLTNGRVKVTVVGPNTSILVRDGSIFHAVTNVTRTSPANLEASVEANKPYIVRSEKPIAVSLSTNLISLPGAARMSLATGQEVSGEIKLRLLHDWLDFDSAANAYTSKVVMCFISTNAPDLAGRLLPLTVRLFPSRYVNVDRDVVTIDTNGIPGCQEVKIFCTRIDDTAKLQVESSLGPAQLSLPFEPISLLDRFKTQLIILTTVLSGALGGLFRNTTASQPRLKRRLITIAQGAFAAAVIVALLSAGIDMGDLSSRTVEKFAGVFGVAALSGYFGTMALDGLRKRFFPA
jgi:hypothetical protein